LNGPRNHDKPVRTVAVQVGIQTRHLLSTSQRHKYLSQSVLDVHHEVEKRKIPAPANHAVPSHSLHYLSYSASTLRLILMIPVRMDTLENSTDEKISISSDNSF
jgi:hypothetical protein